MSLLDQGRENIVVYQQIDTTDRDGNIILKPSPTGTPTVASIQLLAQSGTSQRRSEQSNEGYETEQNYRLRLPRSFPYVLEAQAQILWNGLRWSVVGKVHRYNGSNKTRHVDYVIRRA